MAANITIPNHIYSIHSGKRGRPKKFVDPKVLHDAFQKGRRIPTSVLATALGINQKTLQARIQESDINFRYDEIADEELDALVRKYYQENPTSGRAYIIGRLRAAHALHIVDREAAVARRTLAVTRRARNHRRHPVIWPSVLCVIPWIL